MKFWDYYYKNVLPVLEKDIDNVLPRRENWFKVYEQGVDDIKVVILGQDPYPTKGVAHGLAFSTLPHVKPLPPSLVRIFKEYQDDLGFPEPRTGDLRAWASRGVFLFNTALTVRAGRPASHIDLWSKLAYETVSLLSNRREKLVWLLWGKHAHEFEAAIDKTKHLVLTAGHPSPLNRSRSTSFLGCRHFSKACDYLGIKPEELWKL